ncbi:cutinase family protein [Gordonia sp. VNK1]|jgi:hypothetical protein|uniref:cutinase family protein n=1 Tax=Gordonia oleivorans TaxID=3156618 RepID=UPI0032B58463
MQSTSTTRGGRTSRRIIGAGIAALSATIGLTALQIPATANAATTQTFNLFIPGTWETSSSADPTVATGMLSSIANQLKSTHGSSVTNYFLPYTASAFDNGQTYVESKADAISNASKILRDYASAHPSATFTITGYSQGADAAGDLAASIGNGSGPVSADSVVGVALLADPKSGTAGTTTVGPQSTGTGIAGVRSQGMGALSGRVMSICDPDDMYCATDVDSNPLLAKIGAVLGTDDAGATGAVRETATVVERIAAMEFAGIGDNLNRLTSVVAAGDLSEAQRISQTLNNQLSPLVTAAAAVDYGTVAKVLALIPDETGLAKSAAALCVILDRVDIERTANLVGTIQELAWSFAHASQGNPAALSAAGGTLSQLVEIGQELRALTTGFVNGTSTGTNGVPLVSGELERAGRALVDIVYSSAVSDPAAVIEEAVGATEFLTSDTHVNYPAYVVDGQGTTALNWFAGRLSENIASAR